MEELGKILKKEAITNTSEDNNSTQNIIPDSNNSCLECNGIGWQTKNVPVGHTDFGKVLLCDCQSAKIGTEQANKLYRYSNLESLKRFTFQTLKDDYWKSDPTIDSKYSESLRSIKEYTDNLKGWLVLTGPHGSGKTHLASAIGHYIINKGHLVLFVHVPDLVDHLRSTFHPTSETSYSELFDQVKNTPYLILDDLGLQISSPWAQEKLRQIINYRYNLELPTVITIGDNLSKSDPYILSRIKDVNNGNILDLGRALSQTTTNIGDIPVIMQKTMTFQNFVFERQNLTNEQYLSLTAALNSAKSFAKNPDGWLTLYGETGVGKTHLAVAIAVEQIKKDSSKDSLTLNLINNPDFFNEIPSHVLRVGFAAETDNLISNAKKKLMEKGLALIVANDVTKPESGFNVDTNQVTILDSHGGSEELPILPKSMVGDKILDRVAMLLNEIHTV